MVGLSITQAEYLPALGAAARTLGRLSPPPTMLAGGAALHGRARSASRLGLDAVAPDALVGVQEARRLTSLDAPRESADTYFARLGRQVQELRSRKGWTQQALAEAAALDRTYISGLEPGKQNPTIGALLRLARALAVPLERLALGGSAPSPASTARGTPHQRRPGPSSR